MKSRIILRIILLLLVTLAVMASHCQSVSGIINSYYRVTAINTGTSTLTLSGTAGLTPGTRVLIIQMKGASVNSTNSSSFGNISAINNAGNYEVNTVCGIIGSDVLLQFQLARSYDVSGQVQVVTIPQYNNVTVTDTLKADPWDPVAGTGGVLILECSGTLTLNSAIDVSGTGFTGGAIANYANCVWSTTVNDYALPVNPSDPNVSGARKGEGIAAFITNNEYARGKQANGGGGGNNHNTGGGGGANYGAGGQGGNRSNETFFACHGTTPGLGGLGLSGQGYSIANNKIFLGGGGGAGHENNSVATPGGPGGGIAILLTNTLNGNGQKILANGMKGINPLCSNPLMAEGDGGGGGGGGGVVLINASSYTGTVSIEAKGADGSTSGNATNNCTGPGGGGGGGVVWLSAGSVPGSVTSTVSGGANGLISAVNSGGCGGQANGATGGIAGATLTAWVLPSSSTVICSPLALSDLLSFRAEQKGNQVLLTWKVRDAASVGSFTVERSDDLLHFVPIQNLSSGIDHCSDSTGEFAVLYYRLILTGADGKKDYSKMIRIQGRSKNISVQVFPNPANQFVRIGLYAQKKQALDIKLLDWQGKLILAQETVINSGYQVLPLRIESLPKGIYVLYFLIDDKPVRRKLTKI